MPDKGFEDFGTDAFIAEHKNFILATASGVCGRYITESDDEYSAALMGFHEAMESYDETKGSFMPFAKLVMTRRVCDYIRAQTRHTAEITADMEPAERREGEGTDPIASGINRKAMEEAEKEEQSRLTREEIEAIQQVLKPYGFSLFDLAECSPKAQKTKAVCARAVRLLLEDEKLYVAMKETKRIPVKEMQKSLDIPRKILERHRRYIIAATEILYGSEYPLLGEYLRFIHAPDYGAT